MKSKFYSQVSFSHSLVDASGLQRERESTRCLKGSAVNHLALHSLSGMSQIQVDESSLSMSLLPMVLALTGHGGVFFA